MSNGKRFAKINVTVLVVLILITVAIGASLFAAREVRRSVVSKMDLNAGQAAFEKEDWAAAQKHFQRYLGRNPDDLDVLKKYAKALLSTGRLDVAAVRGSIAAYRRVIQLDPLDKVAYKKLAQLYVGIGNFEELAYVARTRLELAPEDIEAPLWLAEALIRLRKSDDAQTTLVEFINQLEPLVQKPDEYGHACVLMSQITSSPVAVTADKGPLDWLNQACPKSAEALVHRARFYRRSSQFSDPNEAVRLANEAVRLALARADLEAADSLGTEDARIRLLLAAEWLEHDELDRADAELQAVENLPSQVLEEYFLDTRDWTVAKFLFDSQLARRRKDLAKGAELADKVLADPDLTETRHRVRVLPSAITLYVAAGRAPDARGCLDEYLNAMYAQEGPAESRLRLAHLQALVAMAEEKPYVVIDVLQPAVVSDAAVPELWRLLADAFSRTDQVRRAVAAMEKYRTLRPGDPEMTLQLAKEHLRMRNWTRALQIVLDEPDNPTDIALQLLCIEARIYQIAEDSYRVDESILNQQSEKLAELRKDHPDRVEIRILQASIADFQEKPDEAEKELRQATEECSDPLPARMQLVRLYRRTGRMDEAISTCLTAREVNPELAEPWRTLSGLYVAKADYDSARIALNKGLESVAGPWEKRSLSVQMALLELLHGDRPRGISLLSDLAKEYPQEIHVRLLLLALPEVRQNQRITENQPTAEEIIDQMQEAEGESGLYWRLYQADLWLAADDWRSRQPEIRAAAQKCIDSDPGWSAPALLLAKMYEKLEDFGRLEETCRQALRRNPSATDVADVLIGLLEKQGRYSEAEKVLSQTETNPRATRALLARVALNAGDFSRAIEELRVRVSNDDRDMNSRVLLARLIYGQTRDAQEAFRLLEEAEAISSGSSSMVITAARVAILKGEDRAEEARQALDAYVEDSETFGAYAMRAAFLADSEQLDLAEKDYLRLKSFPKQEVDGYELLSDFYVHTHRLDDAVTRLKEGLEAYPDDLRLTRRLMKTLFARGRAEDKEEARELLGDLQKKLDNDPELLWIEVITTLPDEPNKADLQNARENLQKVVKLEPTAVDAHLKLIQIAMEAGRYDKRQYEVARDFAVRALGSNPGNTALLAARAKAELRLRNKQMAAELTRLAIAKDPNSRAAIDALVALVTDALEVEDPALLKQASNLTDYALSGDPANELLLLLRTRLLMAMAQPEAAIPELEAYCGTQEGGNNVLTLAALADAYRLSGDAERAEQRIEQAEALDPNSLAVVNGRLLLLASQNRFDELSQVSSAYLSAKEQNPVIFAAAAGILASSDSAELKKESVILYDAALQLINRDLTLAPDHLELLDTRASILVSMGNRLQEAKDDYGRIVELAQPESRKKAAALLNLGRTCLKLNEAAQAREHLQDALEIDQKIRVFTTDERSEIAKVLGAS